VCWRCWDTVMGGVYEEGEEEGEEDEEVGDA